MHGSRHTVNGKLVDDADFTDDGDEGLGGFDFDLSEVAAFGHLLAGFIGSVPHKSVLASGSAALPSGNVRKQRFLDIWRHSDQLKEVRSIRLKDLSSCSQCTHVGNCTRCPGLAYMEGNMRGPSTQDCEKSFARTGIPSVNLLSKRSSTANLVQIRLLPNMSGAGAPA